jgi:hypothetical protein
MIGPNFYGFCGYSMLKKFLISKDEGKSTMFIIITPAFSLTIILLYLALGLYTYKFYKTHKSNRKKIISSRPMLLAFVLYFTLLGIAINIGDLMLSIDCRGNIPKTNALSLIRFINYYRPLGYILTLFLFFFNSALKEQFWKTLKKVASRTLGYSTLEVFHIK